MSKQIENEEAVHADYIILSHGGSIVEPGTVSPEAEASLIKWLNWITSESPIAYGKMKYIP